MHPTEENMLPILALFFISISKNKAFNLVGCLMAPYSKVR